MIMKNDEIVSFFHKHLVPVFISLLKGKDVHSYIFTAFVLSVGEQWYLVTAGHCIKIIEEETDIHGFEISRCSLIDCLGQGAKNIHPIPFVYSEASPICLSDEFDFDYGFLNISPYYKQLLISNNVQPLNEEVWKKQPNVVDSYVLVGIPAELVIVNPDNLELYPTLFPIEQLKEKPEGFTKTDIPLFYGRITLGEDIKSKKGVSGGPIFGFYTNEKGEMRYWLIALQSRWLPNSRFISAYPTYLLGYIIDNIQFLNSSITLPFSHKLRISKQDLNIPASLA